MSYASAPPPSYDAAGQSKVPPPHPGQQGPPAYGYAPPAGYPQASKGHAPTAGYPQANGMSSPAYLLPNGQPAVHGATPVITQSQLFEDLGGGCCGCFGPAIQTTGGRVPCSPAEASRHEDPARLEDLVMGSCCACLVSGQMQSYTYGAPPGDTDPMAAFLYLGIACCIGGLCANGYHALLIRSSLAQKISNQYFSGAVVQTDCNDIIGATLCYSCYACQELRVLRALKAGVKQPTGPAPPNVYYVQGQPIAQVAYPAYSAYPTY